VTVHIAEAKRIASLVVVVLLIAAVVLTAYALTGSPDPVPVGRS
jgi:hypothetical protein